MRASYSLLKVFLVTYFYELGIKLFNDSISRKKIPQQCNRVVKTFYKNTQLQVKFEVYARIKGWNYMTNEGPIKLRMTLNFPNDTRTISGKDIDAMFAESALGLSDEQVVTFEKPKEKLYKCLKK
jgi:hypothetical protein